MNIKIGDVVSFKPEQIDWVIEQYSGRFKAFTVKGTHKVTRVMVNREGGIELSTTHSQAECWPAEWFDIVIPAPVMPKNFIGERTSLKTIRK